MQDESVPRSSLCLVFGSIDIHDRNHICVYYLSLALALPFVYPPLSTIVSRWDFVDGCKRKKSTYLSVESNNSLQLLFGDFTRSCHTAVALKIHTFRHVCVTKAAIGVETSVQVW